MIKEPLKFPVDPDEFEKVDIKRDFITPKEFAARFGYNRTTITEWCKEGRLKYIKIGKRIYIYKFEFAALIDDGSGKPLEKGTHKQGKDKKNKEK